MLLMNGGLPVNAHALTETAIAMNAAVFTAEQALEFLIRCLPSSCTFVTERHPRLCKENLRGWLFIKSDKTHALCHHTRQMTSIMSYLSQSLIALTVLGC
jgi:hypothetical protein